MKGSYLLLATFIFGAVIAVLLIWIVLWATKKAYSRKWDEEE
ncbi:DUF1049 domain-containing protein [Cohnella cholangitidis]|uniref:DUF1049 domain-containing protein n=1 Tax=Cohnella cholangitidis TaxID=2598458 RepID=A0A7G5BTQ2_9BACL|nr:DUF1049 domain-containing protein [Cohnella cholangitidis]